MTEVSYRLKLRRAIEHAEDLRSEIRRWSELNPYSILKEHDAKGHEHYLVARVRSVPDPHRFSVAFGDCVHCLRSALDHLIYAIAVIQTATDPPVDEKILQFPITDSPAKFSGQKWRIKSLSPAVGTEIERVQPYNRPHPSFPPLLALVRDFDDADKHRLLHASLVGIEEGYADIILPDGHQLGPVTRYAPENVEDGTKLMEFTVDPPCLNVQYGVNLSLAIGVRYAEPGGGSKAANMDGLLSQLCTEVSAVIDAIEKHI